MVLRKSKAASPRRSSKTPTPVSAAELPVTRAMLGEVRTELFERIDQSKNELRAEIQEAKAELGARIDHLRAEVHEVKAELSARLDRLEAGQHRLEAGLHEVKAEVARVALLVEEQNARNRVVMDALVAFIERQGRLEERMDRVDQTVRSLASPRPAG